MEKIPPQGKILLWDSDRRGIPLGEMLLQKVKEPSAIHASLDGKRWRIYRVFALKKCQRVAARALRRDVRESLTTNARNANKHPSLTHFAENLTNRVSIYVVKGFYMGFKKEKRNRHTNVIFVHCAKNHGGLWTILL